MREQTLARLIPLRPWIALGHFLLGGTIAALSFYFHDLLWAAIGLVIVGGALGSLLVPLPYPR